MQILQVKTKGADGIEVKKNVRIVRTWGDISGHAVYLHSDGTYGFKDGAPVTSFEDIKKVIHDPIQLKVAKNWWDRVGEKQSQAYYDALEKRRMRLAGDFSEVGAEDASDKDMILYRRIPADAEDPDDFKTPNTWMEMGFSKRPDWWGQAQVVQFDDFVYIRHDDEAESDGLAPEIAAGQKQLVEMNVAFLNEHEVVVRHIDDDLYKKYGPLLVTKAKKKYVEAETISPGEEDETIYFAGRRGEDAEILIEDLMLIDVKPISPPPANEPQVPPEPGDETGSEDQKVPTEPGEDPQEF